MKRANLGPVWDKPVPDSWLCFCPIFLSFCWSSLVAFGEFTCQKLVTTQLFALKFCVVRQDTFYPRQEYEQKIISKKNRVFISLVGPSETWQSQLVYNWLKTGIFQTKFDKFHFFYQHSQSLYILMQKENNNFEFVQGVNFEFIDSLQNNGTKNLLFFDDSCEEICNRKAFVDIATNADIEVWAQSTLNTTFFTRAS